MMLSTKRILTGCCGCGVLLAACSSDDGRGRTPPSAGGASQLQLQSAAAAPSSAPVGAADVAKRQNLIRSYFAAQRASLNAVATTRTSHGTTIDWVVPQGLQASPPPAMHRCTQNCARTELEDEPAARGPAGTVPVVRFDVESYLASEAVPPETPGEVLRKAPPPSPDLNGFYHVDWSHSGTFYGAGAGINSWQSTPGANVSGSASVAEINVHSGGVSSGLGKGTGQSVEVGQTENGSLNGGSTSPHLFTWFTTNDWGPTGNNVGGYNQNVTGWHQVASDIVPGVAILTSTAGGTQYELEIEIMQYSGAYWVWVNTEWIGYYPTSLFAASGIANSVPTIEFYGEVGKVGTTTALPVGMGSGAFPSTGFGHAAFIRDMHYFSNTSGGWINVSGGSLVAQDSSCYAGSGPFSDGSRPSLYNGWWNYFYYGGPGLGASGCH